jgi:hypothetical protein
VAGSRDGDGQIRRVADSVCAAIRANEEQLLQAEGKATLTVSRVTDPPLIALTCTTPVLAGGRRGPPRRLSSEISQMSDDARRKILANRILVGGARQIAIDIFLDGPRPKIDLSFKP